MSRKKCEDGSVRVGETIGKDLIVTVSFGPMSPLDSVSTHSGFFSSAETDSTLGFRCLSLLYKLLDDEEKYQYK